MNPCNNCAFLDTEVCELCDVNDLQDIDCNCNIDDDSDYLYEVDDFNDGC